MYSGKTTLHAVDLQEVYLLLRLHKNIQQQWEKYIGTTSKRLQCTTNSQCNQTYFFPVQLMKIIDKKVTETKNYINVISEMNCIND